LDRKTPDGRLSRQTTILAATRKEERHMERTNEVAVLIESDMLHCLENWQLAKLREVLGNRLRDVKISQTSAPCPSSDDNGRHLAAFISAKAVEGCSDKTLGYYETTVTKALQTMGRPVECITTDDIRSYLDGYHRTNGAGKVTVDNIRRILSSFFSWLEDEDRIVKSPVRRIHKVRSRRPVRPTYSDEDLESMRDACSEPRDLALVDLLASTGMRVGELVGLDRDRVDLRERECLVLGKGDKERVVYFDARTKVHLQCYLDSRSDNEPALFVTLTSPRRRLAVSGVEIRLRELGRQLKMERVYPHKFRRTLATRAIDKGMPIEQVQRLLGHQKIDTTLMYAMVDQENVRISHRKYIC
jgi:site-specific recombinase XerD